ncbi:hypothetical protein T459_24589 [Capsicum annuum]|uniref:Uncharacterized protein n=1 Tax=Capsicum annuum TaxID=4072 RepID=A0A2G2YVS3_CAPAN|nr:hypothetical protein T459_24589 [Capsicum annuum]
MTDMREEVMDLREIVDLHQLETLSIKVDRYHLVGTRLVWEDLNIIGQWPNLEVLKLKSNACRGLEWHPIEGGFRRLKFLIIEGTNLEYWKATDDHFPALEHLNCSAKLETSAARIQEEKEYLGKKAVEVRSYNDPDVMNRDMGFVDNTSNNTVNDGLGPEWISTEIWVKQAR